MSEPSVVAICLTADRPEMTAQAVASFRAQTYQNKRLLIWDSSKHLVCCDQRNHDGVVRVPAIASGTIGQLRNDANYFLGNVPDIFVHWDSDDLSHPNRIAEQVALLQSSGADVCGFNEVLFWREPQPVKRLHGVDVTQLCLETEGEAWLYRNPHPAYAIGASLCYTRSAWERRPFEATSHGEDQRFLAGLKCRAVSSFVGGLHEPDGGIGPQLLCRIHPGNSSSAYRLDGPDGMRAVEKRGGEWSRVPAWDNYCAAEFAR